MRQRRQLWIIIGFTLLMSNLTAQNDPGVNLLEEKLDSLFESTMAAQRIPGAAFIIVKNGKTLLKKGYGFTTLGEDIAYVNPDSTIFRIGSITKSFTALSLLQLIDQSRIDLNESINDYLSSIMIPDNFNQPITPFHLLTHSAGLDELGGRRVFQESEQIPLATFLQSHLRRIRRPGEITAYSTYGIALAGLLIEELSGESLENYMKKHIWDPLDMNRTSIHLPEIHSQHTSLGYELYNGVNIPQPWEWYHTFPASSINSTVTDMGKYMKMLLQNGEYRSHRILSPSLVQKMLQRQMTLHPEVDGFTFGLYERKWNGVSTVNHGGEMLGYSAWMTLVPQDELGIFIVHHHEGTNLRNLATEKILDLMGPDEVAVSTPEKSKITVADFAGTYRWLSNCQTCPNSDQQQQWTLQVNDDQTLYGFNRTFYQVGPLLFRSTDGERTMGFQKNDQGEIQFMSLGNINVFEKVK